MTDDPTNHNARWQAGEVESDKADDDTRSLHPTTVIAQVQAALRGGRTLTSRQCWIEFGGSRLAAIVHKLRREGMQIRAREVVVPCRNGRTARVAEYQLIDASVQGAQ